MKTAISVPDPVFRQAERYARKSRKSRSQIYSEAMAEYLARHTPDVVTEAMNLVCDLLGESETEFVGAASRQILERSTW